MPLIRYHQHISDESVVHPFDLTDRGLLLGDGVFDTSLVIGGQIALRARHIRRLESAAAALGLPFCREALEALAEDAVPEGATGALRLTITRGTGARGLAVTGAIEPSLIATFSPFEPAFPLATLRLTVSDIARNPTSPAARFKTLSYGDNIQGMTRAQRAGFDDALYCTADGRIACSSVANLFFRFGASLVTPPPDDGVVQGVMRGWILDRYSKATEQSVTVEEALTADAIYATNSLQLIRAVGMLEDRHFETDLPPELQGLLERLVSEVPDD